jgi:hypothetical protein
MVIISVSGVGGRIVLQGLHDDEAGWKFWLATLDQTPELLDEAWTANSSANVASWESALALLDKYPWWCLVPREIHAEFKTAVLSAIYTRNTQKRCRYLSEWEAICTGASVDPLDSSPSHKRS